MNVNEEQQHFIDTILPHHLDAIDMLHLIVAMEISEQKPQNIQLDGKTCAAGFWVIMTNAVIESGILHCRVVLEFLGLKIDKDKTLIERTNRQQRSDDLFIEDFGLHPVSIDDINKAYKGPSDEATQSLAHIIWLAHKHLAHSTSLTFGDNPDGWKHLEIASRGIPSLMVSKFYTPLGLQPPRSNVFHQDRSINSYQLTKKQ